MQSPLDVVAPAGSTPQDVGGLIKSEIVRRAQVVRDSGAKVA